MEQTEVREYGNDLCDSRSRVSQSNDCESGEIVNGRHFQRLGSWTFVLKESTRAELDGH